MPTARKPKPSTNKITKSRKAPTKTVPWKSPQIFIIYGPSGIGKTDLAANFPSPAFVRDPDEDGIDDLVENKRCPKPKDIIVVDHFNELVNIPGNNLKKWLDLGVKTVVYDSITGLEQLCFSWHCDDAYGGDWSKEGFLSYYQGPRTAAKSEWPRFLESLQMLRTAGLSVILIGHSQIKSFKNPEDVDYDKYTPYVDKEIWQNTHRTANIVLFYNLSVEVNTKGLKGKADTSTVSRLIYTEPSPIYDAKNRHGLEPCISAGDSGKEAFDNLCKAFPSS